MSPLPENIYGVVNTLAEMLRRDGRELHAEIMCNSKLEIEETSFDNWDGGVCGYTLNLQVPIDLYEKVSDDLESIEKDLLGRLNDYTRSYRGEYLEQLILEPAITMPSVLGETNGADLVGEINSDKIRFWKKGYFKLFLSHISQHKGLASQLQEKLDEFAISAFVAHKDIEPAKEWQDEIELALSSMDALGALLTEGFKESDWCDQEVGFAIGKGILVIPIKISSAPYGFIGKYQAISHPNKPPYTVCNEIFSVLLKNGATKQRMTDAIVNKLCTSGSYADSIRTVKLLNRVVDNLTTGMKEKLKTAVQENDQVYKPTGVVEQINRIIN